MSTRPGRRAMAAMAIGIALLSGACGSDEPDAVEVAASVEVDRAEAAAAVPDPIAADAPPIDEAVEQAAEPEPEPAPIDLAQVEGTAVVVYDEHDTMSEVANATGQMPTDPGEPLFARNSFSDGALVELVGPTGAQLTLGEWTTARGTAIAECVDGGTRFEAEFDGLIPNGVYTLWQHQMKERVEPDFRFVGPPDNLTHGTGALAAPPFDDGIVIADASGHAAVELLSPAGAMSMWGSRSDCALDDAATVMLVLNYHIDGETYGPFPGPDPVDIGHVHLFFQTGEML